MQQRRESYLLEDLTRTPRDPIKQIDSSDRTAGHHEELACLRKAESLRFTSALKVYLRVN